MIYNNYANMFNQFQSTHAEFNGNHTWYAAASAGDLAGRVISIKKGGEKERLKALAQFIVQQRPHDTTVQQLADVLFERANSLDAPAAASRKKTHKVYKKTKKHAPKAHAKAKKPTAKKRKVTHVKKKSTKRIPKPRAKKSKGKSHSKKSSKQRKVTHQKHARKVTHQPHPTPVIRPIYRPTPAPAPVPPPPAPIADEWAAILDIPDINMPPDYADNHRNAPEPLARPNNVDADLWQALNASRRISIPHANANNATIRTVQPTPINKEFSDAFASYRTNVAHILHRFQQSPGTNVLPMPTARGFSLNAALEEIITYISASWPSDFRIYDEGMFYSKDDLLRSIRAKINDLHGLRLSAYRDIDVENQRLLQRMFGNIFFVITNQIKTVRSLSKKDKDAFDRKIRSFIQSFGITLNHCSDRLVADSTRFYMQLVENKTYSIEDDDTTAVDEKLHKALIQLRRTVFQEAYFSIETNQHDADTQRYVQKELNHELGLYLPSFNDNDAFQGCAMKDKAVQVSTAFYQRYTPARIANHLNTTIKNAIEANAKGKTKQNWYLLVTQYLQNKHADLDLATIYNIEDNSFNTKGLALLLCDLGIIAKNRG